MLESPAGKRTLMGGLALILVGLYMLNAFFFLIPALAG